MFEMMFEENTIVLYLLCMYYIFSFKDLGSDNKRIIIAYLFLVIIRSLDILDSKISLSLFIAITFVYFEFMIDDNFKLKIIKNNFYKLIDYFFIMIFQYKFLFFLLLMFFLSHTYCSLIESYNFFIIAQSIIVIVLSLYLFNRLCNIEFKLKSYDNVINHLMENVDFGNYSKSIINEQMKKILLYYEDRTYYERKNRYTLLCLYYFKYKLNITGEVKISKFKFKKVRIYLRYTKIILLESCRFMKILFNYFILKKPIRGFSTIEMQLLRTAFISEGYEKKPKTRKIFEIIYSNIFFSGLKKYYKNNFQKVSDNYFKDYLLLEYTYFAPIFINNRRYKNMYNLFEKDKLNNEEFFISVLGLSNQEITKWKTFKFKYAYEIEKFSLDPKRLEKALKKVLK